MSGEIITVGVMGFAGRMGSTVAEAVTGALDMRYVGGADPAADVASSELVLARDVGQFLEKTRPEVCVDFSVPATVFNNSRALLEAGIHCVIGATGLTPDERNVLGTVAESKGVGVLVAPNFAVGAVLMMQFAKMAARHFAGAEVVEIHHDKKLDAPSGTSLMTAEMISSEMGADPVAADQPLARGQLAGGVRVHSVRLPGYTAHQEVMFGNIGEALTIRHDSFDRKSFMPGVLLGIRRIRQVKGLVYGLENFLLD